MGASSSTNKKSKRKTSLALQPASRAQKGPVSGPVSAFEYAARLSTSGTQSIHFLNSRLSVRYAHSSERGYYPDTLNKANQDALCAHLRFGGDPEQALFAVFDGEQCDQRGHAANS